MEEGAKERGRKEGEGEIGMRKGWLVGGIEPLYWAGGESER